MKTACGTVFLLAVMVRVACHAESNDPPAAIRNFDLKTIESLGRRIYEQDAYAARATDILFERVGGPERLTREGMAGWLVSEKDTNVVVRFIKTEGGSLVPAYDVTFTSAHHGDLTPAKDKNLSAKELAQFRARQLAAKNIPQYCSERYNFVVLPNVGTNGFLVYALAATTDPNLVLVGGHYRFTVSADGRKVESTDWLSRSCLTIDRRTLPKGAEAAGLYGSHVVSDTPVETHVFLSLVHRQPFFIATPDQTIWKIENGTIERLAGKPGVDGAAPKALESLAPAAPRSDR